MIYQICMLVIILVLTVFYLSYHLYQAKKAVQNQNDERWKMIQSNANKAVICYFNILTGIMFLGLCAISFVSIEFEIKLENIIRCGAYVLAARYIVELLALRYYDRRY